MGNNGLNVPNWVQIDPTQLENARKYLYDVCLDKLGDIDTYDDDAEKKKICTEIIDIMNGFIHQIFKYAVLHDSNVEILSADGETSNGQAERKIKFAFDLIEPQLKKGLINYQSRCDNMLDNVQTQRKCYQLPKDIDEVFNYTDRLFNGRGADPRIKAEILACYKKIENGTITIRRGWKTYFQSVVYNYLQK